MRTNVGRCRFAASAAFRFAALASSFSRVSFSTTAATSFSQCAVECLGNVVQCSYARSAAHASTRDAVGHSSMRIVRHALRRAGRVQAITEVKGPKIGAERDVTHTL